ncbi:MAG: hypothetical protein IJE78_06130 [Bacteroidaceae bacterium]|nr:hypothetical protein [Bacteroidaceae bacterium]
MSVNNLSKIIQHLEPLHIGPLVVDGKQYDRPKIWLKLSPTFFDVDSCFGCGKCCLHVAQNLVLTQSEYEHLMKCTENDFIEYGLDPSKLPILQNSMKPTHHVVNGKEITLYRDSSKLQSLYSSEQDKQVDTCPYLFKNAEGLYRCGVHPVRSITCRMPHLRVFYTNHGCVSVGISQYGRNWRIGCEVQFQKCKAAEQFEQIKSQRIDQLKYLLRVAEDCNFNTYLPALIEYAQHATFSNYEQFLNRDIMPQVSPVNVPKKLYKASEINKDGGQ